MIILIKPNTTGDSWPQIILDPVVSGIRRGPKLGELNNQSPIFQVNGNMHWMLGRKVNDRDLIKFLYELRDRGSFEMLEFYHSS